ncbi:unnamed protein product [Polarella glacialis]|uniref:PDZ domain-containing protein n=1 Tax=Polarella glacialis TaxID=89957 RepID=A0A813DAN2_POLGL|nr:unnamed protein product [Polarella glacialis]
MPRPALKIPQELMEIADLSEPQVPSVTITFMEPGEAGQCSSTHPFLREGGKEVTFAFRQKPLGIHLSRDTVPPVITEVGEGYEAKSFGVERGMRVKAVNGTSVMDMKTDDILDMLADSCRLLPNSLLKPPSMSLSFKELNQKEEFTFAFYCCPCGLHLAEFKGSAIVTRVDGSYEGAYLGVKEGMQVTAINHADVAGLKYSEVLQRIKDSSQNLQFAGKRP